MQCCHEDAKTRRNAMCRKDTKTRRHEGMLSVEQQPKACSLCLRGKKKFVPLWLKKFRVFVPWWQKTGLWLRALLAKNRFVASCLCGQKSFVCSCLGGKKQDCAFVAKKKVRVLVQDKDSRLGICAESTLRDAFHFHKMCENVCRIFSFARKVFHLLVGLSRLEQ